MQTITNYLPGFPTQLQGRRRRGQLERLREERRKARAESISDYGTLFDFVLPIEWLESCGKERRKRLFPEVVTFWAWFSQIIEGNQSCEKAVAVVQGWYQQAGLPRPAAGNSAYCRARIRLSKAFLDAVDRQVLAHRDSHRAPSDLWRGHTLKVADGFSLKLMDTADNQARFPQPSAQKPGCGFPVMSALGVLDLASGMIEKIVPGTGRQHDARGLYELHEHFEQGDVVIGDRAFCGYELLGLLQERGVDAVMRLHQKREAKVDWRRGRRLDADSRLVTWKKPPKPGACSITNAQWEQLPATLTLRLVRLVAPGRDGKPRTIYLATTLIDAGSYPTDELAALYAERWKIEVKLRDIKDTLGLDLLRVRTPAMARKMVRMIQISYNLIKTLQSKAIEGRAVLIDEISFKGTLDVIIEFRSAFRSQQNRPRLLCRSYDLINARVVERQLLIRPGRREPRAIKSRPQPYPYLTEPRSEFVEIQHRSRYRAVA